MESRLESAPRWVRWPAGIVQRWTEPPATKRCLFKLQAEGCKPSAYWSGGIAGAAGAAGPAEFDGAEPNGLLPGVLLPNGLPPKGLLVPFGFCGICCCWLAAAAPTTVLSFFRS